MSHSSFLIHDLLLDFDSDLFDYDSDLFVLELDLEFFSYFLSLVIDLFDLDFDSDLFL
jgi:hypothetical protein